MRVLVTGRGKSGSWAIRGFQLGNAIGAHVEANATDLTKCDAAVIVKRPPYDVMDRLHARGVPIIWDIVDAWPQPEGNDWSQKQCLGWLKQQIAVVRPRAIVAATTSMADDCFDFGVPVLYLPHHVRPGISFNPIRRDVKTVGYEGGESYLGAWRKMLEDECESRGWRFVVNPTQLADLDIVVAVRNQNGYAPAFWKSNVKLANAQGSGTPCVLNREQGYKDTCSGGECWADDGDEMHAALDRLTPHRTRSGVSELLLKASLGLEDVANTYSSWISQLNF